MQTVVEHFVKKINVAQTWVKIFPTRTLVHRPGKPWLEFFCTGYQVLFTLLLFKPTTANIRHATKLREEVCTRIAIGVFDYAEFFPDSKRAEETERSPSFREMAEAWLATVNQLSHSTLSRYRGMLNSHVLPKIGDMPIDRIQYSTLAGLLATLDCSERL